VIRRWVVSGLVVGFVLGATPVAMSLWSAPGAGESVATSGSVNAGNPPSSTVNAGTVTLTWAASTLSTGEPVGGYLVKRYDSAGTTEQTIASGSCASQVSGTTCDETSVPSGTWTYSVTPAYNNWRGAESAKTTVTVGGDTTGPDITITHPSAGSSHNNSSYIAGCGTASTEEICGTASDGAGISTVKISILEASTGKYWNGAAAFNDATETLHNVTGTTSWTYAVLASKFLETSYTIRIVATDTLNNSSSSTATFKMDRTAPTAAITFPVSGSSYNNGGYEAGCATATTGDFCGTSADSGGSGLATVKVSIQRGTGNYWNGTGFDSATEVLFDATGTTSWSSSFAAANFSTDGSYTLRAKALDASGNTSAVASSTFTMDRTTPPAPTITANPTNPSNSSSPSFSFTDSESGVTFQCELDNGGFSACTNPKSYTSVGDGSHTFSVKARDGVGNESAPTSYTWTVDATAPTAAITFPVSGSSYNAGGYNAGCGTGAGDFCGTAADAGTGLTTVRISIQQGAAKYWNGTGFTSTPEVLFTATGTTSWSYDFAASNFAPDGSYTVRAKATDAAGNTTTATSTFTFDTTAPAGSDIQSANGSGGVNGKPEAGDTVTFTYSEAMDGASILAGWSGASTNVVVRLNDGGAGSDTMTVWDPTNSTQLNLGSVNLSRTDYVTGNVTFGATGTPSTMVKSGSNITITLGSASDSALTGTAAGTGTMVWTPSASATDMAGNACSTTSKSELSATDKDF
jgi:chitinase